MAVLFACGGGFGGRGTGKAMVDCKGDAIALKVESDAASVFFPFFPCFRLLLWMFLLLWAIAIA
jgi:hypothetical protein